MKGSFGQDEFMNSAGTSSWTRSRSFALIIALYVIAVAGALVIASAIGTDHPVKGLIWGYGASVAFLYIASQIVGNGSTFDAWWSVMPPSFAIWFCFVLDDAGQFSGADLRRLAVAICASLWGLRLTANWAIGWTGLNHEDWRYRMLYETAPMPRWAVSLTSVHLFPLIVVTLGSIPMAVVASHSHHDFGVLDVVAVVVALTGVALQQFADLDLRRFNRTKQPGDVLNTGLWSRSRHPNYLGEMCWWWSLFIFVLGANPGSWWAGIGAVTMTVMFFTASIPIAEKRSAERRPGWDAYKASTPMVFPRLRTKA